MLNWWSIGITSLICVTAAIAGPSIAPFGFDIAGMDRQVGPGDDFNGYANGSWTRTTVIPADQGRTAPFLMMQKRTSAQLRSILDDASRQPESKVGSFYASYLDEAGADRRGDAPVRPMLDQLAAVRNKAALADLSGRLSRQGIDGLFRIPWGYDQMVSADDRSPTVEVAHLRQGGLSLPNRDYYLGADPKLVQARQAYLAYVTRLLTLVHEPDSAQRAAAVVALETKIAVVHWSTAASRQVDKAYNRWRLVDFEAKAPGFAWDRFLGSLSLSTQPRGILVAQPSAFVGEARLWTETPLGVLKDHQLVRLLDHDAPYLSAPFVDAAFAFHGAALQGLERDEPRWSRGVDLMSKLMRDAVGQAYVQRYFPPETEAAAQVLTNNVVAAWHERLAHVSWMAPATRQAAIRKLDAMRTLIGHTRNWRDYRGLVVRRDDLVGNVARAYELEFEHQLSKLGHPTKRDDWAWSAMRADANNDPVLNAIELPAGIFQPPYFDPVADPAINYGAIGSFIGHEISHPFDDQGRKYDADGRLIDWWTPEDVQRYEQRTAMLVKQYDAYQPLPGLHINGTLVLGETMADLGGLIVGHEAYHRALAGTPPPVLDGFTGEQRFYLGWAQMWRMKYRDAALRQQLLSDPHPPGAQRADIVRNRAEWYQAFDVRPGEQLYLAPQERVDVW